MPDAISVGEESNVMFSINNTGKVMLYNVNAVFRQTLSRRMRLMLEISNPEKAETWIR